MKKTKYSIINLLPVVLSIIITIITCVSGILLYSETGSWAIGLLLCAAGLILNYVCGVILHELGHVSKASSLKMKTAFINLGLFSVDYVNQKITPFTFFGKNAGTTRFIPTKEVTEKQIRSLAFRGLAFSFVFLLIGIAAGVLLTALTKNATAFCLFTAGQSANFYIFAVNLLSDDKTSDGNLAFTDSEYARILAACSETDRLIRKGEEPEEPEIIKTSNQPIALYYHYLFTAAKYGKNAAFKVLPDDVVLDDLNDEEYTLLFPEILYKACVTNKVEEKLETYAEAYFSENQNVISSIRAHFAYRSFVGDEKWSEVLKESYEKRLSTEKPFVITVERKLTE